MLTAPGRAVLDTSRGGPLSGSAQAALQACGVAGWCDPDGLTAESRRAGQLLAAATDSLARALDGNPDRVRFAPGGASALTLALRGLCDGQDARNDPGAPPATLIVSTVDHASVLRFARWSQSQGRPLVEIPVDEWGRVDAEAMIAAARRHPRSVVCVQLANGETGTLQSAAEVLTALDSTNVGTLLDATACVGRISIPSGASVVVGDAIAWGGPRGVGLLVSSARSPWRDPEPISLPDIPVALIAAAAAALEAAAAGMSDEAERARGQIARVRETLPTLVEGIELVGDPADRLPHVLTVSVLYVDGESLVQELDRRGIAVGSGSACANDSGLPSHVLAAMGALTGGNVRVCLPLGCPDDDIDQFLAAFPEAVQAVRAPVIQEEFPVPDTTNPEASPAPAVDPEPETWIDERGSRCPAPVIALGRAAFTREAGTVIAILASDPAAGTDIPAWCRLRGADFIGTRTPPDGGEGVAYLVRLPPADGANR